MDAHEGVWLLGVVILLPLVGAVVNGLFGKRLGDRAVTVVGVGVLLAGVVVSWILFVSMLALPQEERALQFAIFPWIHVGRFAVDFSLWLDPLSAVMLLVVTNVGFLIHLYSVGYMKGDPGYYRYFAYLNLFIFAMLCLVLGENLLVLFLGWEGVGLCSYLLIGFWFEDRANARAGKKVFIVNRVGDFGIVLGMMLLYVGFGTLEPQGINGMIAAGEPVSVHPWMLEVAALALFLGACGKSAQIPLHVWLPDAMAGPVPVSALIQSATMVTAGVYLIARLNGLFFAAEFASHVVLVIGAATALFAATIGLVQNDIKKVLAWSTVSQLGFMFVAMGVGAWGIGVFHLMTHAFFKACLFLGSGSVIMAMHHQQDMRLLGGLRRFMPITHWTFLAATLAIAGVVPFAGFFSTDEILWWSLASERGHPIVYGVVLASAFCTAFYMLRIMWMTFWGEHRGNEHERAHGLPKESPWTMTVPLVVLGVLSLVGGLVGVPEAFPIHLPNLLHDWLGPVFADSSVHLEPVMQHNLGLERVLMGISLAVALASIGLTWLIWGGSRDKLRDVLAERVPRLHKLLWNRWYVDELYELVLIGPIVRFSREVLWRIVDEVIIDGTVNLVGGLCRQVADGLGRLQDGDVGNYATVMLGGLLLVLLCLAAYGLW